MCADTEDWEVHLGHMVAGGAVVVGVAAVVPHGLREAQAGVLLEGRAGCVDEDVPLRTPGMCS